jgi:hypothetical protein
LEGTLSEFASAHGQGPRDSPLDNMARLAVRGVRWHDRLRPDGQRLPVRGTGTAYLGGSTLGAIVVGFLYGRNKRV